MPDGFDFEEFLAAGARSPDEQDPAPNLVKNSNLHMHNKKTNRNPNVTCSGEMYNTQISHHEFSDNGNPPEK